jgi:hypothetical protein
MVSGDYRIQIEFPENEYDEDEQEQIVSEINEKFDVELSRDGSATELADPVTMLAIYAAILQTASLYIQIKSYLDSRNESVRVNISHEGVGNVTVINSEEAEETGANVVEELNETTSAVEMTPELARELRELDGED